MEPMYKARYNHRDKMGLTVPLTCHFKFEHATEKQKFDKHLGGGAPICNGCGPSGYGPLVPDYIIGVCVTIAGHIHNWGYQFGTSYEHKRIIDETFQDNMDRLIRARFMLDTMDLTDDSWIANINRWYYKRQYRSRLFVADKIYANAVRIFGKSAFWDKRKINFSLEDVNA